MFHYDPMRSEVKKLGRDYRGDTPETGEGDDTFHVTKDSPTLPRRDRLRSRGEHPWPAAKPRETTHLWPAAKHEGDIPGQDDTPMGSSEPCQRWQQKEATDASHHHIATPATPRGTTLARLYTATSAKPRETTLPWPDTNTTHLRSRGRQHFSGQVLHLHVCEAEGRPWPDTTSPHHHRPQERLPDKKIFHISSPSPSSRTSWGRT